jgi:hypothetical protein
MLEARIEAYRRCWREVSRPRTCISERCTTALVDSRSRSKLASRRSFSFHITSEAATCEQEGLLVVGGCT